MDKQNELKDILTQLKKEENTSTDTVNTKEQLKNDTMNANALSIMAYIDLVLSIVGAIFTLINYSKSKITDEFSIIGIVGAIGILIAGLTLFFLLKTIVDIYWKVEE